MNTLTTRTASSRKVYLEAIRMIASFFVIFNHTGSNGFFLFAQRTPGSAAFWVYLFFSVLCTVSVPLFFMISGALMLNRENEPLGSLWKNKIGKNILIIFLFAFWDYLADLLLSPESADLRWMVYSVINGNLTGGRIWYGHLWFLYAYIAYLICLPFLRGMVKHLENRYFYYMIGLVLLIKAVIPAAEFLLAEKAIPLSGSVLPHWLTEDIIIYPCIGYFLEHRIDIRKQKRGMVWLWAAALAAIAVTGFLIYRQALFTQILEENEAQTFHQIFVLLPSMAVYVSVKYFFTQVRIPEAVEKTVLSVGRCTFGIYLIHMVVLDSLPVRMFLRKMLDLGVNNLLACFIQCAAVFFIGFIVTALARKIPLLRKIL